jgi:hypothetical protein
MPMAAGKPFSPRPDFRARMGSGATGAGWLILFAKGAYSMVRGRAGGVTSSIHRSE